ncbi:glycosyltransferase [Desulfosporosinus fructosivorans]|uniref:Glycosyltransferase n=1 Tax=Desulfosporosinus fructosivorans TaxID=2018669 RepID=A0A4Z0QX68_9FIRM|nr:glycosyltransferase [Desulfosporosinus fructosivorans]TGE35382.1 glycosyltransferase [Desulfosporosinus fructosivorans]
MIDQALAKQVLVIINSLIEEAQSMYDCAVDRNFVQVETTARDMLNVLEAIYPIAIQIKEVIYYISAPISCENLLHTINRVLILVRTRSDKATSKIEFELIPILKDFYYDFYFFTSIFGDKEKEKHHYEEEYFLMNANPYIDRSIKNGQYKYDISILILAYNKLDYTKQCIESVLKFTPGYLNYELILIDNGSNDGTSQYFESLSPTKIFTLQKNSLNIMVSAVSRIIEGRYLLSVSNDVIVTENYLDNLINCIESDSKIAMVVPATPNISNLQTISAGYSTLEGMHAFAKANNISDSHRWEERTRLCNPLAFYRSDIFCSSQGIGAFDKYFIFGEFGDDAFALRVRRAGYKMILAKDCYCYHFGSITNKEAHTTENTLEKSRKLFIERYGVDAWSKGFCYDPQLIATLTVKSTGRANILGINSGFGSNPLKIITLHKEAGNEDVGLHLVTDDERYIPDLQALSNDVRYVPIITDGIFNNILFDFILLEGNVERVICESNNFNKLRNMLTRGGTLAICATNNNELQYLNMLNADKTIIEGNYCWLLWYSGRPTGE